MEEKKNQQRNLLIVDDETSFLKLLARIFQKRFIVKTASSGENALEIMKSGFSPGVILSDQRMPNMTGDEFLEKSMEIKPDATRIILTGYTAPKDIIACVNKGHAFMYLTKPSEELELVQAVRLGFERYESLQKNKKLIKELKKTISSLEEKDEHNKKLLAENKAMLTQTVQSIAGLINMREKYYFRSHSHNVAVIAKAVAQEMNFKTEAVNILVLCSLLHGVINIGMPLPYQLTEPFEIDEDARDEYFKYFNKAIENLKKIKFLEYHARVISQIWEHSDGTGYPAGISGNDIELEAQIIAFSNIYHSRTYRIPEEKLPLLKKNGQVVQTPTETKQRHAEAIKFFYRKANWFNVDAASAFHEVVRKKECPALLPVENALVLKDFDSVTGEEKKKKPAEKKDEEQNIDAKGDITIEKQKKKEPVEKELKIDELEPGMVVAQNVATKNGILIVRQDNVLTKNLIQNIRQMEKSGMLYGSKLTILFPPQE